jgi:hypothetical protein
MSHHHPKLRVVEDQQEKFCTRCDEWWPADKEFFYADLSDATGLFYCCKACYQEWKTANTAKKLQRSAAISA